MVSATATPGYGAAAPGLSFRSDVSVAGLRRLSAAPPQPPPPPPLLRKWCLRSSFPSNSFFATLKRSPKRLKYTSQRLFKKGEGMVYVKVDPSGEDTWKLEPTIDLIKEGAVGVIPTDTVYSIVCDLTNPSSIERLRRIKGIGNSKYTFILPASKQLPKQCIRNGATTKYAQRKHVGVRLPDDVICQAILQSLDAPLICTSVKWPSEDQWILDPAIIADVYEKEGLDFVVDGGLRVADPSTVVDMTGSYPTIIRQGKGPKLDWMVVEGEDHG